MNTELLNHRSQSIHAGNVQAGWWTNIATNESIVATRNRPEIMMLVVTELSEANEGALTSCMDDKLPHRPMVDVEVADAAIRLHDLAGAEQFEVSEQDVTDAELYYNEYTNDAVDVDDNETYSLTEALMGIVDKVSFAMEGYRKSNTEKYRAGVVQSLVLCYILADQFNLDVDGSIREKLEFNKVREDHQISNRLKEDGKKI